MKGICTSRFLLLYFAGCFLCADARAQVTNDNFNYQLQFRQSGNWGIGTYGQAMNFYVVNDTDSASTYTTPFPTLCYYYAGLIGPEVALNVFTTTEQGPYKRADLSIRGFTKSSPAASSPSCTYSQGVSGYADDVVIFEKWALLLDPRNAPKTALNYNEFTLSVTNTGTAKFREYWRYVDGDDNKAPLKFGTLDSASSKHHLNNNYPRPYNDAAYNKYGYTNRYIPELNPTFTNAPDVIYTFDLTSLAVVNISTNNAATNFNTKLHLIKITGTDLKDFVLLDSNDDISASNSRSALTDTLCAGTYGIVVEGSGTSTGVFDLTLNTQSFAGQPGGLIDPGHTIPFPQELARDYVNNVTAPSPFPATFASSLSWEQSTNNGTSWAAATGSKDSVGYVLPVLNSSRLYRRVYNVCNTRFLSNEAAIKVVFPNGVISGKVISVGLNPVGNIPIAIYKKGFSLPGSPADFTYRDTTEADGTFSIQRIYYGDPDLQPSSLFTVKPIRPTHKFDRDSAEALLTDVQPSVTVANFVDSTVYSITGKVEQVCDSCLNVAETMLPLLACPLDSVRIYSNVAGVSQVFTGYDNISDSFGRFVMSVQNPALYGIFAEFRNRLFSPPSRSVTVNADVANVNFTDPTTHIISGRFTAGCNDFIGTATLEFSDILPNDKQGLPRSSCFKKRVTTNSSGFYSIKLPARKYSVKVVSFTRVNGGDVTSPDLLDFFETKISKDSLIRDISDKDTTLNLVYQRPPQITLQGLDNDCTRPDSSFVVIQQGVNKTFLVKVYQGPVAKACPVTDTTLLINTNVQQEDNNEAISLMTVKGVDTVRLRGGTPNIVYPFYKTLNVEFKDVFGRTVSVNRNVVVTGLKANVGTFTTVSPQVPLMILHDPPGDNSFSSWETSKTNETALRFFTANNASAGLWSEVKIGTSLTLGIGVATETSVWGSINGAVNVATRKSTDEEAIISTTTTQTFSTSADNDLIGSPGDVYIGTAFNLKYGITNEIRFTPPCEVTRQQRLMVANDSFKTQFIYTEDYIRNTIIPSLAAIRDNPGSSPEQVAANNNQLSVWEQVLANNEANKRRAVYQDNVSFAGGPEATYSISTSSTKSSTIEFNLEVDTQLAAELGLEVAGSGVKGGVNVGFKMETGNSRVNTTTTQSTIKYTLKDDDVKDAFSVNIKKDPVYNTPVFELVAGTSSCPHEPGTQPRDEMQLVAANPVVSGVAPDAEAEFVLKLSNISQSGEQRTYQLSFNQASNPNGAIVTIGGSPVIVPVNYTIGYLGEVLVTVKVRKGASNIFSYEGLQFQLSDACDGGISKTVNLSVYFTSTCSSITLQQPENNWVVSAADNNILPVLFKNYNLNNLTSVTLEYSKEGLSNWVTGFTRTAAQINNSSNGTLVDWNIAGVPDGAYNLRLKLNCPSGVVYSERTTGVIDRTGPQLLGRLQPSDDNYTSGDIISADYNENLDCASLTNFNLELKNLSGGQLIDARLGCFQNNIVVVPLTDLKSFTGDSIRVTLKGIADIYGNVKAANDSWKFVVGSFAPDISNKAMKLVNDKASVQEDSGDSIIYTFKLPASASSDIRVNYTISGTAVLKSDFGVSYGQPTSQATSFNGAQGSIMIWKGTRSSTLRIKPVPNDRFEPNKSVTLTLAEGGDYNLGDSTSATGTIVNDDSQSTYVFDGNGDFTQVDNWQNGQVPPYNFLVSDEIIINPAGDGACILNVPLRMRAGGKFTLVAGKKLIVNGNVRVANY